MIDFGGQRVVVTGATGGLGSGLVKAFEDTGASVVSCDVPGLAPPAGTIEHHAFDMRDHDTLAIAAQRIVANGAPAAVVLNAGRTRAETLDHLDAAQLLDEIAVNLTGAALLSQALLPAMRQAGGGAFVFISSVNAAFHYGNPAYSAAKAGVEAFMRAIAVEEGRHGVRANAVAPGSIRTAAWDHRIAVSPDLFQRLTALYPLGRFVTVEEVANAVLFLASPLASGITGATLRVDAGVSAGNLPFLDTIV